MYTEPLATIRDALRSRDLRKAETLLARLLRADMPAREQTQALVLRARARLLAARPEEALDDLQAARPETDDALRTEIDELTADACFARFELASVGFADRAHAQRAEDLYRAIVEQQPDYANLGWVHYQLGRICLTNGQTHDALAHFRDALLAPSAVAALTAYCFERLGFAHFYELRQPRRALAFLDKALATYPAAEPATWIARVQTLRSRVLRELGEADSALAAAEAAIQIAQADETRLALADALLASAELLAQLGGRDRDVIARAQQFTQIARKPLGIDVTWSRAYEMLGNAHFNLGQYAAAGAAYEQALHYNPYHPWEIGLHYQIARSHYHADAFERAIDAVERLLSAALKDNQTIHDYRIFDVLGNAHFALKHHRAAADAYETALRMAPPNAPDLDKIRRYYQFAQELRAANP